MSNILKKPSHRARLARHGHDLSRRVLFTSSCGHIIPVHHFYVSAGDKVSMNDRLFTRTQPLKTPAFIRSVEHLYYFYVPISQIDSYYGQAKYGISDFTNTNDLAADTGSTAAIGGYVNPGYFPALTFFTVFQQLFGINTIQPYVVTADSAVYFYYRQDYPISGSTQTHSLFDQYGIPQIWNSMRLMESLGYSSKWFDNDVFTTDTPMNPYPLLAYQKIWYDFFRLSTWQRCNPFAFNLNYAYKGGFNVPYLPQVNVNMNDGDTTGSFLTLHYHPLKKDFFTNVEPSPLFDVFDQTGYAYNVDDNSSDLRSQILSAYGVQLQGISNLTTRYNDHVRTVDSSLSDGAISGIDFDTSVQSLRLAFAYDRLLAITQRAGKHYDDQVRAHLGVSIPQGISNEVYYLGCHSSNLMIGEVVSTAAGETSGGSSSVLGELGGRGLGSSNKNKRINFTAPDDGIVMILYACVPEVDYKDEGIDRQNLYTSIMYWPRPEFDRLGMQPLYLVQSSVGIDNINTVIGWQYRWAEFKLTYDIVHGAFNHTLSDWTSSIVFGQFGSFVNNLYCPPTYFDGVFALNFKPETSVPSDLSVVDEQAKIVLSVSQAPGVSTTVTEYTPPYNGDAGALLGAWSDSMMYERDPLLHSVDLDIKLSSWMSTYGLPNI